MNQQLAKLACLCLLLFGMINTSYALPSDRTKTMLMMADKVHYDNKQKTGEYIGDVLLKQGTSILHANNAKTYSNQYNQLEKAIAYGSKIKQADFETALENEKEKLKARANKITYFPIKQLFYLEGNAQIKQGANQFKAPMIIYDMVKKKVISNKKQAHRRSTIIIKDKVA